MLNNAFNNKNAPNTDMHETYPQMSQSSCTCLLSHPDYKSDLSQHPDRIYMYKGSPLYIMAYYKADNANAKTDWEVD